MGDEHLNTISATESDEFIKSCVENLVPNLSEFEGESECDMPAYEAFTTFSNVLFDADYDFYSNDDQGSLQIERDTHIIIGRGFLYTCGSILNTIEWITSTFYGIFHQTFLAAKTSLDTTESDSDDDEEYAIQRNKFGASLYGPKPA
nr:hypothetical protein [Tanacetum cinerariifolium]